MTRRFSKSSPWLQPSLFKNNEKVTIYFLEDWEPFFEHRFISLKKNVVKSTPEIRKWFWPACYKHTMPIPRSLRGRV